MNCEISSRLPTVTRHIGQERMHNTHRFTDGYFQAELTMVPIPSLEYSSSSSPPSIEASTCTRAIHQPRPRRQPDMIGWQVGQDLAPGNWAHALTRCARFTPLVQAATAETISMGTPSARHLSRSQVQET